MAREQEQYQDRALEKGNGAVMNGVDGVDGVDGRTVLVGKSAAVRTSFTNMRLLL